ncbi:serine protease [Amanita muscaria]
MRFTSAALALLALVVPAICAGLITVERANGRTSGNLKYIVTLKKGVNKADLISQMKTFNVTDKWDIINGFAGHCDDSTLNYLRAHSDVESIAENSIVSITNIEIQTTAPWGLERISQVGPVQVGSRNSESLTYSYTYDQSAGKGVDIYVIGIYTDHSSFQGRARWGATFGGYKDVDGHGHGTYCAGVAASYNYGVAKAANLIAVKAFADDGQVYYSFVNIAGMEWVQSQAASSNRPSVASMSFGNEPSTAMDKAVASLTNNGIHVVVSAGNDGVDASNTSPARAPSALTVGASDIADNFASFSNYGAPVKVIAPGVDIISAWIGSPTTTKTLSGTSMAAPLVSGLLAYIIAMRGNVSPEALIVQIQNLCLKNNLHRVRECIHLFSRCKLASYWWK